MSANDRSETINSSVVMQQQTSATTAGNYNSSYVTDRFFLKPNYQIPLTRRMQGPQTNHTSIPFNSFFHTTIPYN